MTGRVLQCGALPVFYLSEDAVIFRLLPVIVIGVFFSAGLCPPAAGIVIDDFTVGQYSATGGATNVVQAGLDDQHVVGGERKFSFGGGLNSSNALTIDSADSQLTFTSGTSSRGYFDITYGATTPLNVDFMAQGHDRFRFVFSNVTAPEPYLSSFSVITTPTTNTFTTTLNSAFNAFSGTPGGIAEIPFKTTLGNVSRISIYVGRFAAGGSFTIESIGTAGPPLQGDYNRDGVVDMADYAEWRRLFGKSTSGGVLLTADGNGNGVVDQADYVLWRRSVGQVTIAGIAAVPEPTTICIAVIVAAIVGGAMRSRLYRR
jgi:hypothetical protein